MVSKSKEPLLCRISITLAKGEIVVDEASYI